MQIYCDESGGVGSGVMLLAAVAMADAEKLLTHIRAVLGLRGELGRKPTNHAPEALKWHRLRVWVADAASGASC